MPSSKNEKPPATPSTPSSSGRDDDEESMPFDDGFLTAGNEPYVKAYAEQLRKHRAQRDQGGDQGQE